MHKVRESIGGAVSTKTGLNNDVVMINEGVHMVSDGINLLNTCQKIDENHPVFKGHFPEPIGPILPGVMTIELIGDHVKRYLTTQGFSGIKFIGVSETKFTNIVKPGDELSIKVVGFEEKEGLVFVKCEASVGGEGVVKDVELIFGKEMFNDGDFVEPELNNEELVGRDEIKSLIPHREPILLVDSVKVDSLNKKAIAKRVVQEEDLGYNEGIMPNTLMIEALAQAGAVSVCKLEGIKLFDENGEAIQNGKKILLSKIANVSFFGQADLGDELNSFVELKQIKVKLGFGRGKGVMYNQNGEKLLEADLSFAIVDN